MKDIQQLSTLNFQLSILMIEDDTRLLKSNRKFLESEGYYVIEAEDLRTGRIKLETEKPDMLLLDIMLPDGDGIEFCKEIRQMPGGSNLPILMVSAKDAKTDVRLGLEIGADDYITKPYDILDLITRVNTMFRRCRLTPKLIKMGALTLNLSSNHAYVNDEDINLSPNIGFSLLNIFVQNENKILSAEFLYGEVWGQPMHGNDGTVRTAVSELRKKLTGSGFTITQEQSKGYIFEAGEK